MKKLNIAIFSLFLIIFSSCEEVVELDLEKSEPRLVIEASIKWIKGTEGNNQSIRLSTTTPYYENENIPVDNAFVSVTTEDGSEIIFSNKGNGIFTTTNFSPNLGQEYTLKVIYEDDVYIATENLIPVPVIDYVDQERTGGFNGDEYEIKAYYTDPANEQNFYFFIFENDKTSIEIYEDEFTDGNQIFGYYSNEDIEAGDEIDIELAGISKAYYNYLFILRSQVGDNGGGPFQTQPATVKGNVLNTTNNNKFPFGYFRLSEVDKTTYTVQE